MCVGRLSLLARKRNMCYYTCYYWIGSGVCILRFEVYERARERHVDGTINSTTDLSRVFVSMHRRRPRDRMASTHVVRKGGPALKVS